MTDKTASRPTTNGRFVARRDNPRRARALAFAAALAALSGAQRARAGAGACDGSRMDVSPEVDRHWRDAIDAACSALHGAAVDSTAHVRFSARGADLLVEVALADGRAASRRLSSTDALLPTLEALVVLPAAPAASNAPPSSAPPSAPPDEAAEFRPRITSVVPDNHSSGIEPSPPPVTTVPGLGIDLGGGFGGRIAAHGYLSAAPGAFAELRLGSWLFGTQLRWDVIGGKSAPLVDVFEMETVLVGITVARRVRVGFGSVDVGLSPRLAVETQTFETGTDGEQSFAATDIRLGAFTRVSFGTSAFRPMLEVDGDLSPSRLRRVAQLDPRLPALPSWSAGLSAGVSWTAP